MFHFFSGAKVSISNIFCCIYKSFLTSRCKEWLVGLLGSPLIFLILTHGHAYWFQSERGREGKREGEKHQHKRKTLISCPEPTTQACALTRNCTHELWVYKTVLQPTEPHWPEQEYHNFTYFTVASLGTFNFIYSFIHSFIQVFIECLSSARPSALLLWIL